MLTILSATTENPRPLLVLAVRRNTKPIDASRIHAWNAPPNPNIRFTSVVGERLLFRIEEDFPNEGEFDSLFPRRRQRPDASTASAVAGRDGRFSQGDRDSEFSSSRDSRRPSAAIGNAPPAPVPAAPPAGYGYGYGGPGGPGNGNGNAGGWKFDAYPGRNDVYRYEDPDRPDQPPFGYQTKPMW